LSAVAVLKDFSTGDMVVMPPRIAASLQPEYAYGIYRRQPLWCRLVYAVEGDGTGFHAQGTEGSGHRPVVAGPE